MDETEKLRKRVKELENASNELLDAWDQWTDPKVRVGPVWPRMRNLAQLVGRDIRQ